MADYVRTIGASPGRGTYSYASDAEKIVWQTRALVADVVGTRACDAISFTLNATQALNTLIKGLHRPGQSIIVTPFEHNSVLRPAYRVVAQRGGKVIVASPCPKTGIDLNILREQLQSVDAGMLVCTHASNVTGRVLPIEEIAKIARAAQVPLIVDLSQSAGVIDVRLDDWGVDHAAGTGHKGLLGPQGVGFLFVRDPASVETLYEGGAGGHSLSPLHPQWGPEKFEAGTPNIVGLAGLRAALLERASNSHAYRTRCDCEYDQVAEIAARLAKSRSYKMLSPFARHTHVPIISINLAGVMPAHLAFLLEARGIATRAGLHCAPLAHRTAATYPNGSVRLSFGPYVDDDAYRSVLSTLEAISATIT